MTLAAVQGVPAITAWFDDALVPAQALAALTRVEVWQRLSAASLCELVFVTGGVAALPGLRPGLRLRLTIGDTGRDLFAGDVTAIEYAQGGSGGLETRVRAYDVLHRLGKRQPVRTHMDVGLVELARELTADLGVSVAADAAPPILPRVVQWDQSDLELLVDQGERVGLHLSLVGSTLHLTSLAGRGETATLRLGRELIDVRVVVNGQTACRRVEASGWDPATAEVFSASAAEPRRGWEGRTAIDPSAIGGSGERALADEPAAHLAEMAARAQAELDWRSTGEVIASGTAIGDPVLVPGSRVRLEGIGVDAPTTFTLTEVTHTFDALRGFTSRFSTEPPARRPRPRTPIATTGIVTRVDDPEGLGRVRAQLPTIGGLETEWLAVAVPAAGADKGLIALPDLGDTVLVLLPHGGAGRGVVLGGLYGTTTPPDTGVDGGTVVRHTWTTRGRQRVTLDDAGSRVCVETAGGSLVEMRPDRMTLHAASDLVIEAPGRNITVRAAQIDFEPA